MRDHADAQKVSRNLFARIKSKVGISVPRINEEVTSSRRQTNDISNFSLATNK